MEFKSDLLTRERSLLLFIFIIIVYGIHLRVQVVTGTELFAPIRADAGDYYKYSYNLANNLVFSRSWEKNGEELVPDSLRSPGFPIFASLFVSEKASDTLNNVIWAQTWFQIMSFILLTLCLVRVFKGYFSLLPIFMLWTFPHFISFNIYFLTESLFISVFALSIYMLWRMCNQHAIKNIDIILAGAVFGWLILIRPIVQYFPLFLIVFCFLFDRKLLVGALKFAAVSLTPFILWKIRNYINVEEVGDPALVINALFHGSYPWMMYNNDPATFGYPYTHDPQEKEYYKGIATTLSLIWQRAAGEPVEYLQWYLYGKQLILWQWSIIAGQGDFFIYPVETSPYMYLIDMYVLVLGHLYLHDIWVGIGFFGGTYFVFKKKEHYDSISLFYKILAILFLYIVLIHVVVAPFPRYGVPFKILMMFFAFYAINGIFKCLKMKLYPIKK